MVIKNAKIITMEDEIIENGYISCENGRISNIGTMESFDFSDGIDVGGAYILPGFIDIHTHLGIVEDSLSFEGDDVNEDTDPVSPALRALDAINPQDKAFLETKNSGVTTVLVTAGSANPIAGQMALLKTDGKNIDKMLLNEYIGMKFALGENPKSVYNSKNQTPVTRMATVALIRETLFKAREYYENKLKAISEEEELPDFEFKYEALIPLFEKKAKAHFHAHRADDIFTAIRICKEFDLELVLVHATEGYMIADEIKDYPLIIGPIMTDRSKPELSNLNLKAPKILSDNNVLFALSTDHPETPLKFLSLCSMILAKEGMSEIEALKTITINPAKIIGVDDKIGSLKVGKDADFVVMSHHPFDYRSKVLNVFINGKEVYCASNSH